MSDDAIISKSGVEASLHAAHTDRREVETMKSSAWVSTVSNHGAIQLNSKSLLKKSAFDKGVGRCDFKPIEVPEAVTYDADVAIPEASTEGRGWEGFLRINARGEELLSLKEVLAKSNAPISFTSPLCAYGLTLATYGRMRS